MYVHVWRSEANIGYVPLPLSTLFSEARSHWTWSSLIGLDQPAHSSEILLCWLSVLGLQADAQLFIMVLVFEFTCVCLDGKDFVDYLSASQFLLLLLFLLEARAPVLFCVLQPLLQLI